MHECMRCAVSPLGAVCATLCLRMTDVHVATADESDALHGRKRGGADEEGAEQQQGGYHLHAERERGRQSKGSGVSARLGVAPRVCASPRLVGTRVRVSPSGTGASSSTLHRRMRCAHEEARACAVRE
jgi:hypothetical protein